jgi:quercetin dioxygenase-like cupin family protein
MYVVEGALEISFPDTRQSVKMRAGDRIDIPAGIHHAVIIGNSGAKCVEAAASI